MRTTLITLLGAAALAAIAGCTVKDVDQPPVAGPSTFGHQIIMTTERNTLTQNGVDFADIRIVSLSPTGQSETLPLRAQIYVGGVAQDFGTLSTKDPVAPTTIRYTVPPGSTNPQGQAATTVSIVVTPTNSGDARAETARQIDLRLQPQGVILPSNPSLLPDFTVSPDPPTAGDPATFDASLTTNEGSACALACSYAWDFGDGTTGAGMTTTHTFARSGNFAVRLTVTDARGAQAQTTKSFAVNVPTPPTAEFTSSPGSPGVNQDVFFDATASTAAPGHTIRSYDWSFGDGSTGTGVVQAHKFTAPGSYSVTLVVTDDAGTKSVPKTTPMQVGPTVGPAPTASMTCQSGNSTRGIPVFCNASASQPGSGATIISYAFNWGVGQGDEVSTTGTQSHLYTSPGTFTVTMTVTDSLGRTAVSQQTVTVVNTP